MAIFQKKQKVPAPVLSKEALLLIKHEAWQESERKLASLNENHANLIEQQAALGAEHHSSLVAHGLSEEGAGERRTVLETQISEIQRKIVATVAACGHQQAIHAEITRELNALQQEISQQKHRDKMAELEMRVKTRKEQLIAHLYGGCGLMAELVKLADEAYAADERAALSGDLAVSNAGRRFVEEALEDLNLRTTPIIMMERAGFLPVRSSLAFAQRAFEVRALVPPEKG